MFYFNYGLLLAPLQASACSDLKSAEASAFRGDEHSLGRLSLQRQGHKQLPEQVCGHLPASVHASGEDSHPYFKADEEVRYGPAREAVRVTYKRAEVGSNSELLCSGIAMCRVGEW